VELTDGPINTKGRHASTRQIARWFSYGHLPAGTPRHISAMCAALAGQMVSELADNPELVTGLRKLLEAKDCFVRAAIAGEE
jgi:hypothetical protein